MKSVKYFTKHRILPLHEEWPVSWSFKISYKRLSEVKLKVRSLATAKKLRYTFKLRFAQLFLKKLKWTIYLSLFAQEFEVISLENLTRLFLMIYHHD